MKYKDYDLTLIDFYKNPPSDWEIKRNKDIFSISKIEVGEDWKNFDLLSLSIDGVIVRDIEGGKGKFPTSFESYQIVEKNDLIFCLYDIDETPRTVGISDRDGMISGSYKVVKCFKNVIPKFIYYLYLSIDEIKGLKPFYSGLRNVVRPEIFMNLKILLPSIDKQEMIVKELEKKEINFKELSSIYKKRVQLIDEQRISTIENIISGNNQ